MASYNFPLGVSRHDPDFEKILRIINSFRGYETLEDLKRSDEQVRTYLAQQLRKAADESAGARKSIERGMHLQVLPDFDVVAGRIRACSDRLLGAGSGKIATCKAYQPEPDPVRALYVIDYKMLSGSENIYNLMQEFTRIDQEKLISSNIHKIDLSLRDIARCMKKRAETIDCMLQ
jgi:hypothetical protein